MATRLVSNESQKDSAFQGNRVSNGSEPLEPDKTKELLSIDTSSEQIQDSKNSEQEVQAKNSDISGNTEQSFQEIKSKATDTFQEVNVESTGKHTETVNNDVRQRISDQNPTEEGCRNVILTDENERNKNEEGEVTPADKVIDLKGVPIDRGWAWMIVLSCFVLFFVYSSHDRVHSVLLVDYLAEFDISVTVVTVMMSLGSIFYCFATQTSVNVLTQRFSIRTVITIAAVINVGATLLQALLPGVSIFFIANLVKYAAKGTTLVATLTLVGFYFQRRRALAIGLGLMGSSTSAMLTPPLIRFLREEYGFRGCFLIFTAFEMHAIAAALLLRPLKSYTKRKPSSHDKKTKEEIRPFMSSDLEEAIQNGTYSLKSLTELSDMVQVSTEGDSSLDNVREFDMDVVELSAEQKEIKSVDLSPLAQIKLSTAVAEDEGVIQRHSVRNSRSTEKQRHGSDSQALELNTAAILSRAVEGRSDWSLVQASLVGSVLSIAPNVIEVDKENAILKKSKRRYCSWLKSLIDLSLLKNYLSIMLIAVYVLSNSGAFGVVYLPSHARKVGTTPQEAALLLTINGASEMVARLAFGFFADLKLVRPNIIIAVAVLCLGIVYHLPRLFVGLKELIFFAAVQGFLGVVPLNLNTVLVIDVIGIEKLAKMLSMDSLFLSISFIAQHPIHGAMIESTGNFMATFHYVGVCFILVSVLLLLEPCIRKLQVNKENTKNLRHTPASFA